MLGSGGLAVLGTENGPFFFSKTHEDSHEFCLLYCRVEVEAWSVTRVHTGHFFIVFLLIKCSFFVCLYVCSASISSFLTVLAWYPNTSLKTWCLVLHSLTLMTNMPACGQSLHSDCFLSVTSLPLKSSIRSVMISFVCECVSVHSDSLVHEGFLVM